MLDLLTRVEIAALTGYRQPRKQIEWLRKNGFRCLVAADGHPRVLRSWLEQRQTRPSNQPNFGALNGKAAQKPA